MHNCKYNRGKTACTAKLREKLDGTHVTSGTHSDTCLMKIDQVIVVKTGDSVPEIFEEMKTMIDNFALMNLFTTPSSVYQIIKHILMGSMVPARH